MAKFTILKPPPGHPLHIPTAANLIVNLTFALEDPEYKVEEGSLRISQSDNSILVLDDILKAAANEEEAPVILQPDQAPLNTRELLLKLGGSPSELVAKPVETAQPTLLTGNIDELLNSSLHREEDWQKASSVLDSAATASWPRSSYILSVPLNTASARYLVDLNGVPGTVVAGSSLSFYLCFNTLNGQEGKLCHLPQPAMFYLAFIPGSENYNLQNFLNWENLEIEGAKLMSKGWKVNEQGAGLLKIIVDTGDLTEEWHGQPAIKINVPLFDTYLRGAACSITLAAIVGQQLREGEGLNMRLQIEPNLQARVLFASPNSAEAFCFNDKSMEINPPNLVIRGLNFNNGDCVQVSQLLKYLGTKVSYDFSTQGQHLLLQIKGPDRILRIILENCSLEDMLMHGAFIATDQSLPEWLTYYYISEQFVAENAVADADILLTVRTLLNAFLAEEDYMSMQTVLNNLGTDKE